VVAARATASAVALGVALDARALLLAAAVAARILLRLVLVPLLPSATAVALSVVHHGIARIRVAMFGF
jgi:hypothetical protein